MRQTIKLTLVEGFALCGACKMSNTPLNKVLIAFNYIRKHLRESHYLSIYLCIYLIISSPLVVLQDAKSSIAGLTR